VDEADLVILITDHDSLDLGALANRGVPVLDTRNRVRGPAVTAL